MSEFDPKPFDLDDAARDYQAGLPETDPREWIPETVEVLPGEEDA